MTEPSYLSAAELSSVGTPTLWAVTIAGVLALLVLDFLVTRRPHEVSMREALGWSAFYIALPLAFGGWVWSRYGSQQGVEYLTGYLVEKSLSVDNLFVFMLLLAAFAVPAVLAQRVLLYGIAGALVLRAIFIALGAAALQTLDFAFLLFAPHPDRHRGQAAARRPLRARAGGRHQQDAVGAAAAPVHAGGRRVPRHEDDGPAATAGGRSPRSPWCGRGARHRHRLRRRLGARRLRHHRGPVPGLRHQRVRPARPAGALLRAARRAEPAGAPQLRPGHHPGLHRRQARPALGARHLGRRAADPDPGLARRDHRRAGGGHPDQPARHPRPRCPAEAEVVTERR